MWVSGSASACWGNRCVEFCDCRIEMLTVSQNCPQVSKIEQLNGRKKLAVNRVTRMVTFIKLKCKKERRLKNKG